MVSTVFPELQQGIVKSVDDAFQDAMDEFDPLFPSEVFTLSDIEEFAEAIFHAGLRYGLNSARVAIDNATIGE